MADQSGSDRATQRWGVIVGTGVVAAALGTATLTAPRNPAPETEKSAPAESRSEDGDEAASPTSAASPSKDVTDSAAAEPAQSPAQAAPVIVDAPSFLAKFREDHPLGRAQALQEQGRYREANEAALYAIRTRREFNGLCFDRFTAGGAEVVLRSCNRVPRAQRAAFERTWSQRLTAMASVEYAEPNHTLLPEGQN